MKKEQYTLGTLIHDLKKYAPDKVLCIEHGDELLYVRDLISWRGAYEELSIDSESKLLPRDPDRIQFQENTVGMVLTRARSAVGSTFEGYKGGDFIMEMDTAVWGDPYGMYDKYVPYAMREEDDKVVIETVKLNS